MLRRRSGRWSGPRQLPKRPVRLLAVRRSSASASGPVPMSWVTLHYEVFPSRCPLGGNEVGLLVGLAVGCDIAPRIGVVLCEYDCGLWMSGVSAEGTWRRRDR